MNKIREIIRLNESNLSQRQISIAVGISLGAVNNYLNKIKISSKNKPILYEDIKDKSDDELLKVLNHEVSFDCDNDIDFIKINRELKRNGVTLKLLYEENIANYQSQNIVNSGYSYSSFCRAYKKWKNSQNITLRQKHKEGEKVNTLTHASPYPLTILPSIL